MASRLLCSFLFSGLLLAGCVPSDRQNIKEYYFPVDELNEGVVYEYRTIDMDSGDTLYPRYSYVKSIRSDSGLFIIINDYDQTFFNDQYILEEQVGNGILLADYHYMAILPGDSAQRVNEAEVVRNSVFPFSVSKTGGVTPMELHLKDPADPKEHIRFVRERKFLGDTVYTIQGKDIPAIMFQANEVREFSHEEKGDFDNVMSAIEIYAKGIGMVSRKYKLGDARLEMALYDTFGMRELEKLAGAYWGREIKLGE